jgi:hypothetical protein
MQQLITGLLLVVQIQLNMFRAFSCPSSGAYQLQQQPLVYRRNVVVAVLLFVVGPAGPTTNNSTASRVFHCTHSNSVGQTGLLTDACSCQQTCMTYTIAVFTVKNS